MKISAVITVLNQHDLAKAVIGKLIENSDSDLEIIIIDNGSDIPFVNEDDYENFKVVRNEVSTGVYPTYKQGFEVATGDIVAFFHSDFVIWEKDWDKRVANCFEKLPRLGMIGFIGSTEIDAAGGRGLGTASNFMGRTLEFVTPEDLHLGWAGSPAEPHGKRLLGYINAAVVDGCAMIIRRDTWSDIGFREDFPPHHFYDKLISTQILEKKWEIGVLGVQCDHFSGQTVNTQSKYQKMAYEWLKIHAMQANWPIWDIKISEFDPTHNYDEDIYKLSEFMWLSEYRDTKHLIPIRVHS